MAGDSLTFWDYLKAAFRWKTRLPLLGAMPLNQLALAAFFIFGFVNRGFWLLGIAFETAYLMLLAGSPRFQHLVRALRLSERRAPAASADKTQELIARLKSESRERYGALRLHCERILQADPEAASASSMNHLKREGLEQLLIIYLKILSLRDRIAEMLARTQRAELVSDIQRIETKLKNESPESPVSRALKGTLDIQQARLANLDRSTESLKFSEAELDRIEKQVQLIAEEVAVSKDPSALSATLDSVVQSIQGTTKWLSDNAALFEAMDSPIASGQLLGNAAPGPAATPRATAAPTPRAVRQGR